MTITTKPTHGGPRPGSGKPRIVAGENTRRILVRVTEAQHGAAEAIGAGNVARGIRRALDAWQAASLPPKP